MNKEIGGYFELEKQTDSPLGEFHKNAVRINLGRNAIPFLALTQKIETLYLPHYLCDTVEKTCISCGINVKKYHIDSHFLPKIHHKIRKNDYLYVVNYFGLVNRKMISNLRKRYKNLIVDNVQSFFSQPVNNVPTIYSCRKFFGVPDGAYIYSDKTIYLERDFSSNRFKHLNGRLNSSAQAHFNDFKKNEELLSKLPLLAMSDETHSIMERINYTEVISRRTKNFNYLNKKLSQLNQLKLGRIRGAYCYPLLINNGKNIKEKLIKNKIYIPSLWPNLSNLNTFEQHLISNLLILPCDQRYNARDMDRIVQLIYEN